MYSTLKRKKSTSSQAASISAWCAVFDWPSIVAALSVSRHGPASSSAARRNTDGALLPRPARPVLPGLRAGVDRGATSSAPPWWTSASTCSRSCGITAGRVLPVETSLPPITSGTSIRSPAICSSRAVSEARSGLPGAKSRTGSLWAGGTRKMPCVPMLTQLLHEVGGGHEHPDHEPERRGPERAAGERPVAPPPRRCRRRARARPPAMPEAPEPAADLPRAERGERRADDHCRRRTRRPARRRARSSRRARRPAARAARRRRARRRSRRTHPARSG